MNRVYSDKSQGQSNLKDIISVKDQKILIFKVISITLAIIVILLMAAVLIISNYPKSQGYVIEIAADGSASVNPDSITLLEDWDATERTKQTFLGEFVTELRSVSSDPQIVANNITKLYYRVTGNAADEATKYIKETDPKTRLKNETVTIKIASILPISDTTYQIDFRETVWTTSKRVKSDTHYRMVAHIEIYKPRTKEQGFINPIGLYVSDYTITEVKEI